MGIEGKEPDSKILRRLATLHEALRRGDRYELDGGKWKPEHIVQMLELRKQALELTIAAVKEGHNRGTVVESMVAYFNIEPNYPMF